MNTSDPSTSFWCRIFSVEIHSTVTGPTIPNTRSFLLQCCSMTGKWAAVLYCTATRRSRGFNTATLAFHLHVSVSRSGNSFTCTTSRSFLRTTHICSSHSNSSTSTSHRRTSYGDLLSPIKTQTLLHPPSSARRLASNTGTVIHVLFQMKSNQLCSCRNDGHSFSHLPLSGCPDGLRFSL